MGTGDNREEMDCKEFERLIPDFIARKMDYPTLRSFYGHIERCAECKEELNIQFLVTEGIQRLEDGNAFDLQLELEQRLEETRRKIRFHSVFLHLGIFLEIVAVCLLAAGIVWMLL